MYIDLYTGIKIPVSFIIINSKSQIAYEKVLEDFYRIITNNNTIPIGLQSYTIDYEIALENSLKKIFINAKHVGCFFHYIQCLIRWLKKNGYGSNEYKKSNEEIAYLLTIILFKYKSNMKYIEKTILNMKKTYPDYEIFYDYYEKNWYKYLESGVLDYTKITKLQRCNSYLENYNKIIKNTLGKIAKISWPKFITFIHLPSPHFILVSFNLFSFYLLYNHITK